MQVGAYLVILEVLAAVQGPVWMPDCRLGDLHHLVRQLGKGTQLHLRVFHCVEGN